MTTGPSRRFDPPQANLRNLLANHKRLKGALNARPRRALLLVAFASAVACHDQPDAIAAPEAGTDAGIVREHQTPTADAATETFSYRCPQPIYPPEGGLYYEEKKAIYWFCSPELELPSEVPIRIVKNDVGGQDQEFRRWTLEVNDVIVVVDIEHEWLDFSKLGWSKPELEDVVYPETFGRSARRVLGDTVKRQNDLMFTNDTGSRLFFSYKAKLDQVKPIDRMIDRAHIPICRKASCSQ